MNGVNGEDGFNGAAGLYVSNGGSGGQKTQVLIVMEHLEVYMVGLEQPDGEHVMEENTAVLGVTAEELRLLCLQKLTLPRSVEIQLLTRELVGQSYMIFHLT